MGNGQGDNKPEPRLPRAKIIGKRTTFGFSGLTEQTTEELVAQQERMRRLKGLTTFTKDDYFQKVLKLLKSTPDQVLAGL